MPKRHEKPIIRMEIDEVARMLDLVESGEAMSERQRSYNQHTRVRDLAILTLFLDTGIRVSELVGINIDDVDFSINGFLVVLGIRGEIIWKQIYEFPALFFKNAGNDIGESPYKW